jgi:hypothetical protein
MLIEEFAGFYTINSKKQEESETLFLIVGF